MPWTVADVDEHKKGLSDRAKKAWVKVANKARVQCMENGGNDEKCDAQAIKAANAVTRNMNEMKAESIITFDVDGERVPLAELVDIYRQLKSDQKEADMKIEPEEMAEAEVPTREQVAAVLVHLWQDYKPQEQEQKQEKEGEEEEKTEEMAELAESASGAAISLVEAEPVGSGAKPLQLDIALIKPGWGNDRDKHYYGRDMLKRDAPVFKGTKMYATDHRQEEKSVRTEVSEILDCPVGFTDEGKPIARVGIYDPTFAESVRNRAALGTLHNLQCSILAKGKTKKGEVDGKKGNIVEAIIEAISVDWVTRAGAGGHALNLAESDDGGEQMSDEEKAGAQEEGRVEESQEQPAPEVALLSESEVADLLGESNLPDAAKERLAEAEYENAKAVEEAVKAEVTYLKTVTGSGKPIGQGGGVAPDQERMSESEYNERYNEILQRHGVMTNLVKEA